MKRSRRRKGKEEKGEEEVGEEGRKNQRPGSLGQLFHGPALPH